LTGIVLTGTTIYVIDNQRKYVQQIDVIPIAIGTYERCLATQYQTNPVAYRVSPPSYVRTWINTNGVAENVTNAIGFYINKSMMDDLDTTIKQLVPYYTDPDTIIMDSGSSFYQNYTVTSLWAKLGIGDKTNQFTQVPAIGTNAATFGDYSHQIYAEALQERYKVLQALNTIVHTNPTIDISLNTNRPASTRYVWPRQFLREYPKFYCGDIFHIAWTQLYGVATTGNCYGVNFDDSYYEEYGGVNWNFDWCLYMFPGQFSSNPPWVQRYPYHIFNDVELEWNIVKILSADDVKESAKWLWYRGSSTNFLDYDICATNNYGMSALGHYFLIASDTVTQQFGRNPALGQVNYDFGMYKKMGTYQWSMSEFNTNIYVSSQLTAKVTVDENFYFKPTIDNFYSGTNYEYELYCEWEEGVAMTDTNTYYAFPPAHIYITTNNGQKYYNADIGWDEDEALALSNSYPYMDITMPTNKGIIKKIGFFFPTTFSGRLVKYEYNFNYCSNKYW